MKDRFKFRIPMFTDKGNFQEFQYLELGEQEECTLCGYNGEPQQCTGLKDKNGKLIYEGDIVKNNQNSLYSVEFEEFAHQTKFCLKRVETPDYYPHISTWQGIGYKDQKNFEVIGNIYENPELLED